MIQKLMSILGYEKKSCDPPGGTPGVFPDIVTPFTYGGSNSYALPTKYAQDAALQMSSAVMSITNAVSQACAGVELGIFPKGETEEITPRNPGPPEIMKLLILLEEPTYIKVDGGPAFRPHNTWYLRMLAHWNRLAFGEGFLYVPRGTENTPLNIWSAPSLEITPESSVGYNQAVAGSEVKYLYSGISSGGLRAGDRISQNEMIHYMNTPTSKTEISGKSVLEQIGLEIKLVRSGMEYTQTTMDSGRLSGAFMIDKDASVTQEQRNAMLAQFISKSKSQLPAFIQGGINFTPFSLKSSDMQYMEAIDTALQAIAVSFGYPPQWVIQQKNGGIYNNEQGEARAVYYHTTIFPWVKYESEIWTSFFLSGTDYEFRAKTANVPAIKKETVKTMKDLASATGYLLINELREIVGYSPLDGELGNVIAGKINKPVKPEAETETEEEDE